MDRIKDQLGPETDVNNMEVSRDSNGPRPNHLNSPNLAEDAAPDIGDVTYRLARSRAELEGAFRVLQRRYSDSGLTASPSAGLRIMPYHFWANTQVFIAVHQNTVVGSVSLVRDGDENGLPMESTYPEAIDNLRSDGVRLAEVCCLCVGSDRSFSSGELFANLTRIMMFHARHQGVDSLVAVVHPRHGKFYRLAMGFKEIGGLAAYRHVAGQPGVPILGQVNDEEQYRERWKKNYFAGQYSEEELRAEPMSMIDREYFKRHLDQQGSSTRRKAA